jgi:hypothetical protein
MLRRIPLVPAVIVFLVLVGCSNDNGQEPFDFARDTPAWLKQKIAVMSTDTTRFYARTKVYRYNWHAEFVYHISIPLSSCMYCEIYDQPGNRIQITNDAVLQDFLNTRTDEVVVWESTT